MRLSVLKGTERDSIGDSYCTCLPSSDTAPAFGMELVCLSMGSGKGWSGAGRWFGGGIMLRGSMSAVCGSAVAAAPDGHSDTRS